MRMQKWRIFTRGHLRYEKDPSNPRLFAAGDQNNGSAIKHQHEKGTLRTHSTAQNTVTQYSLPGFWRFLFCHLNILLGISNITKTGRSIQCRAWPLLIRLVGWGFVHRRVGTLYVAGLQWKTPAHQAFIILAWHVNNVCMCSAIIIDAMPLVSSMDIPPGTQPMQYCQSWRVGHAK